MLNVRKPPIDYEKVFKFKGSFQLASEDEDDAKNCTIEVDSLPDLVLTTGKIKVGDPFSIEDGPPIAKKVNRGTYTVEGATRRDTRPDNPDSYWYEVACLRVVFSRLRPVRWTPAMPSSIFSSLLASRANECCLADALSIQKVCGGGNRVFDLIDESGHVEVQLDAETGGNLVRSGLLGYGSGPRCLFWGIDKNDNRCRLVCDFGVLSESIYTKKIIGTVQELLTDPISLKTRYGQIEARARKYRRGQELRISISGDSVKNWHDLEFDLQQSRHCRLFSSMGGGYGKGVEFRYEISSPKTWLENLFAVKYKTRVRSLLDG